MPKTSSTPKKKTVISETPEDTAADGPRVLSPPRYHWYKPSTWQYAGALAPERTPLPKARLLLLRILNQLWDHKQLFGGIVLTFGLLNIVLVRGTAGGSDLSSLKDTLDSTMNGAGGKLAGSLVGLTYVITSSNSGGTDTSAIYQTILLLICSLAFIWALRQVLAGQRVRVRDSFYEGMYPLVPFLLVIGLLGLQLMPIAIGGALYSAIISNGIAVHVYERLICLALFLALALWSLRMATATLFALYIVTLPEMTPLRAYRSARDLVKYRQLIIWRKLIFLPVVLLVASAVIELPLILFLSPVAVWSFFVISMCMLPVVHGYLYNLYRELL